MPEAQRGGVSVPAADPGPEARLLVVQWDAGAAGEVFRLLTEGDTLREVAKKWALPRGAFTRWFMETHGELFDAAARVRADELVNEALADAENAGAEDVAPSKLRVDTKMRVAEKWDRARYGAKDTGPIGGITVIVDRSCGGTVEITAGGATARIPLGGGTEALPAAVPALGKMEI